MQNLSENIVDVSGLEFRIDHKNILHAVDFKVRKGEVFFITGASGCGKTVLAKIIAGELRQTNGRILVPEDLKIEMVSQQDHFVTDSGLRMTYYGQRYENPNQEGIPTVIDYFQKTVQALQTDKLNGIANSLEIEDLLQRKLLSLSNGERKRVQLAGAILKSPDLLILDQPFVGLDVNSRQKLGEIIKQLKSKGKTIIIISDPAHIPDFADNILELKYGTVFRIVSRKEYLTIERNETNEVRSFKTVLLDEVSKQKENYQFIVRMKNVNVSFGSKMVLTKINWEVKSGERWVLTGQNGAGKTTLLSLITADNPQGYTNDLVLFDRKRGSGESIWDIKKKIGFISPELHLYFLRRKSIYQPAAGMEMEYSSLTCLDVILSGLKDEIGFNTSFSERSLRLGKLWLKILKMEYLERSPFLHSSIGEQRIILLGRALIKMPELLILDEPCQGLDPSQTERFLTVLDLIIGDGKTTMIYVTHRTEEIPASVTHQLQLEGGFITNLISWEKDIL